MADDIIEKIDATLLAEANSKRFDPLGENWDNNETDPWTSGDAMRRRPASTGSEEEPEPVEAAPQHTVVAFPLSSVSLFEPGGRVSITLPASSPVMYVVSSVDTIGAAELEPDGAPADSVADAMRAEVLRQGLTTCEIDGVRQEYRDGQWFAAGGIVRGPWRPFGVSRECAMSGGSQCEGCAGEALDGGTCGHGCHAEVTVMTPEEAAGWRAHERLSLECSRRRPMCSGCDGEAIDHGRCIHGCHPDEGRQWSPPVAPRPFLTAALDSEAEAFETRAVAALDELVEPDPDDAVRIEMVEAPEDGDTNSWGADLDVHLPSLARVVGMVKIHVSRLLPSRRTR